MDTTDSVSQLCVAHQSIAPLHIVLVVLGALLHNLMEMDKLIKNDIKFNFWIWLNQNWLAFIITSIALVTMFLLRDELKQVMGFDMSNRIGCFLAGFTVHTFTSKANGIVNIAEGKK